MLNKIKIRLEHLEGFELTQKVKNKIYEYEFDDITGKLQIIEDKIKKLHDGLCKLSDEIGELYNQKTKKAKK